MIRSALAVTLGLAGFAYSQTGNVVHWGSCNESSSIAVPVCDVPNENFIQVAAGNTHALGIRENGTIISWGNCVSQQCLIPAGSFLQIDAGIDHSIALRIDGAVKCWGSNSAGQCDAPEGQYSYVAARGNFSCALRIDGTAVCWGENSDGQCEPPADITFTKIAATRTAVAGLKADGSVVQWGEYGDVEAPGGVFSEIAAGRYHFMGLRPDGTVECWGPGNGLELENPIGLKFQSIAAGGGTSAGVLENGSIVVWGTGCNNGYCVGPSGIFHSIDFFESFGFAVNGEANIGACCSTGETGCAVVTESICDQLSGTWYGVGSSCFEVDCPIECTQDLDSDGTVGFTDLLELISAWGPCSG